MNGKNQVRHRLLHAPMRSEQEYTQVAMPPCLQRASSSLEGGVEGVVSPDSRGSKCWQH